MLRAMLISGSMFLSPGTLAVASDGGFPVAPVSPSGQDCTDLYQMYVAILEGINDRSRRCMQDVPIFGKGQACYPSGLRTEMMAWSQCSSFQVELCEAEAARKSEHALCLSRVKKHKEKAPGDQDQQTNQRLDNTRRWQDRFQEFYKENGLSSDAIVNSLQSESLRRIERHNSELNTLSGTMAGSDTEGAKPSEFEVTADLLYCGNECDLNQDTESVGLCLAGCIEDATP